jgi:hypothetical protein
MHEPDVDETAMVRRKALHQSWTTSSTVISGVTLAVELTVTFDSQAGVTRRHGWDHATHGLNTAGHRAAHLGPTPKRLKTAVPSCFHTCQVEIGMNRAPVAEERGLRPRLAIPSNIPHCIVQHGLSRSPLTQFPSSATLSQAASAIVRCLTTSDQGATD